ncbi:helix-turn-helix transcriptional regulator [Cobetia amphilecti]|uniref:Helix-turn-helix transcriptional regulator n=1 Tax=Cobetia amphilecti TaxID=1055104 RepID=A0AAP4TWW2_9GAMM|nr:helix-turn-helix transcriptional regulator [Cobetia amphilecti]MDO6671248.1 helix-turn-helix transcriptional regulator [Cobetia amphilecti]
MKVRIKQKRKEAGLSQDALAKQVGVTKGAISQWEQGATNPSGQNLYSLAKALRVTAEWLLNGGEQQAARPATEDELILHEPEFVDEDTPLRADEVEIPYFREVEMAAGDGRTQVIENHGVYMRFSLARLMKAGVDPKQAACATVTGDSMEPIIVDGCPIGIDKSCRSITDGKIYALDHGGMLRVKRLYRLPLGRMRVVSDNHIEYPEEVYTLGDPDAPKIIGRVFWWEVFA